MKSYFAYLFIVLLLVGCDLNTSKNETIESVKVDKLNRIDSLQNERGESTFVPADSVILKYSAISNELYSLRLETYFLDDNVELSNDFIDNIVLKQEIAFLLKDSIVKKMLFPVKKLKVNTEKGRKIEIQENNIYKASVVKGQKGWLYKISGGGVLGSQSEFYGLYTPSGKLLWYSYSSYQNFKKVHKDIPNEVYGDFDEVLKEYDISEPEFNKPEKTINIDVLNNRN